MYDRDNNEVHLSDFVGKPVALNFWASWCAPSQSEMPDLNGAYAGPGEEIHFLIVNLTTSFRESFSKGEVAGAERTQAGLAKLPGPYSGNAY